MKKAGYALPADTAENKFAVFISFILNPLILAPLMFQLIISAENPVEGSGLMLWIVVFYALVPFIILASFRLMHKIETLEVRNQHKRHLPFALGILSYICGFAVILSVNGTHGLLPAAAFTLLISSLAAALINIRWKISIHCAAVAIAAVFLCGVFYDFRPGLFIAGCMIGILAIALMGWSRISLQAHTPGQVAGGILLGLFSGLMVLRFYPM